VLDSKDGEKAYMYYRLVGKKIERCSMEEFCSCFESDGRIIAAEEREGIKVSTVFLGINHGFDGEPVLFETMVFGGEHDGDQYRWRTWEEAEKGHKKVSKTVWSTSISFGDSKRDLDL